MQTALKRVTFSGRCTGRRVSVRDLISVLEKFTTWLRSLDPDAQLDWEVVKIKIGQNLSFTFQNPHVNGKVSNSMSELSGMQGQQEPSVAPRLSEAVINSTSALGELVGREFVSLKIQTHGVSALRVTPKLIERVKKLVTPSRRESTTIQGVMDQVTFNSANQNTIFRITHPLTGNKIACNVRDDAIGLEEVKKLLPHRVQVYGRATLNRDGNIVSIDVTQLTPLPEREDAILFDTLPAINITNGMDAAAYVERVRSGE